MNYNVFDLFFDLPHPAASAGCEQAKVVTPHPESVGLSEVATSELFEPSSIARVSLFAFPEYEKNIALVAGRAPSSIHQKERKQGAGLNIYDVYYSSFIPCYHTFSLQLRNGMRIHGHVRRYLPTHKNAKTRYDIGRRGIRALVILTRAPGGERFYSAVLKTMESIIAISTVDGRQHGEEHFLHALEDRQSQLNHDFIMRKRAMSEESFRKKTEMSMNGLLSSQNEYINGLVIEGTEFKEDSPLVSLDSLRFVLPKSLQPGYTGDYSSEYIDTPLLPLLRAVGVSHTLRLLSALLCECRVIFISAFTHRLNACTRAAVSLLGQGLLVWQHLMVPVLPPHLIRFLSAPEPYIIGLLDIHATGIELIPDLGEVLCINLDENTMETYHMTDPATSIPDLLAVSKSSKGDKSTQCCDVLSQDLVEIVRRDKAFWMTFKGDPTQNNTGPSLASEVYEKDKPKRNASSTKNALSLFGLEANAVDDADDQAVLYGKILRSLNYKHGNRNTADKNAIRSRPSLESMKDASNINGGDSLLKSTTKNKAGDDNFEIECYCENETAEDSARVALTVFYLFIIGDMGMYLSEDYDGTLYCDRKKYVMCRLALGGKESSPLFQVLKKFARTPMFKQFIKSRIRELEQPLPIKKNFVSQHRSLFSSCERFIRLNKLDWTLQNINSVVQRISQYSIKRKNVSWCEEVRQMALTLMSYQDFDNEALKFLAELIDHGCEINGALCQIMGVVWTKLLDERSNMWRHPLIALHLIRSLLLHGPLTAITEITDGIHLIRGLKNYMNKNNGKPVRVAASEVMKLVIDRQSLFQQRRLLSCKRLKLGEDDGSLDKERKWLDYIIRRLPVPCLDFENMHKTVEPKYDQVKEESIDDRNSSTEKPPDDMDSQLLEEFSTDRRSQSRHHHHHHRNNEPEYDERYLYREYDQYDENDNISQAYSQSYSQGNGSSSKHQDSLSYDDRYYDNYDDHDPTRVNDKTSYELPTSNPYKSDPRITQSQQNSIQYKQRPYHEDHQNTVRQPNMQMEAQQIHHQGQRQPFQQTQRHQFDQTYQQRQVISNQDQRQQVHQNHKIPIHQNQRYQYNPNNQIQQQRQQQAYNVQNQRQDFNQSSYNPRNHYTQYHPNQRYTDVNKRNFDEQSTASSWI